MVFFTTIALIVKIHFTVKQRTYWKYQI